MIQCQWSRQWWSHSLASMLHKDNKQTEVSINAEFTVTEMSIQHSIKLRSVNAQMRSS